MQGPTVLLRTFASIQEPNANPDAIFFSSTLGLRAVQRGRFCQSLPLCLASLVYIVALIVLLRSIEHK